MLNTLTTILPLDFASTLSPVIFALAIILLSTHPPQKVNLTAFFIGTLSVGIIATYFGFHIGQEINPDKGKGDLSAIIDIILGVVFLFFAFKSLVTKDKPFKQKKSAQSSKFLKWLSIGFIINATNFDALFLNLTAARIVGRAHTIPLALKYVLLCLNLIFLTLPITLPVVLYLLFPVTASKVLSKINEFLLKYSRYIIAVLFFILGFFFLKNGLVYFI